MPVMDVVDVSKAPPRRRERIALLLSACAFFMVLCPYYIIRPVRDQLGGAVGSEGLPLFYLVVFLVMLAITPLFGALVARYPRRRLIIICYSFFIVCLLLFVPAFAVQEQVGAALLGSVFYAWVSVFNLFVVSLFWSLMADLFDTEQSHRLFPLIGIAGSLGALTGPILTSVLVGIVGVAPLLLIAAVVLAGAMGILLWLSVHSGAGAAAPELEKGMGGSVLAGLKQAFMQPFVRLMAILMLLSDGIGTVAYALLADYAQTHIHDAVTGTAFYARIDTATNLLVILLQVGVTRWLLVGHGAGRSLLAAELLNVVLFLLLCAFATNMVYLPWFDLDAGLVGVAVPVIALVMIGSRALAYGIIVPASNTLYTRAPREARYKGKNFVETAVWRFGDVVVTSGLSGLKALGAGIPLLAACSAVAAGLAGCVGWRAGRSTGLDGPARPES